MQVPACKGWFAVSGSARTAKHGMRDFRNARRLEVASVALQVRQKLYNTAIGKWRKYEEKLQPVITDLHEYTEMYESALGARKAHDEL